MKVYRFLLLSCALLFALSLAVAAADLPKEKDFPLGANGSITMVYVDAGSFRMGNTGNERPSEVWSDESPLHPVKLSAYWMGKYEVTRGQYRSFMEAEGYTNPSYWSADGWRWKERTKRTEPEYWAPEQTWSGNAFTQTDLHPVTGVTYYEAEAFCKWAGGHLPTEAQWEKAARWTGQSSTIWPWGSQFDAKKLNSWYNMQHFQKAETAVVGSYPAGVSPYGCQDMAGNVWEWCSDWYGADYYSHAPSRGWVDPKGPSSGTYRVCRGGSLSNTYDCFRCAARSQLEPGRNWYTSGFRMAR